MKELDASTGFVGEAEDGSTLGIFTELGDDKRVETVEGFTHVARFQSEEHAQTAGESQHGRVFERLRISSTTTGIWSRFKPSIRTPDGKVMRMRLEWEAGTEGAEDSTTTSAKDGWLTAWEEDRFFCRQVAKVEYFKSCSWQKAMTERPLLLKASRRASRCSFRMRRRPRRSMGMIAEGGSIKVVDVIDHHLPPLRPSSQ